MFLSFVAGVEGTGRRVPLKKLKWLGEVPVQPYRERNEVTASPLCKHSLLHYTRFQIVREGALNPSPIFFKIMNLPVAAKLVIFKKYFFLYVLKCMIPSMTIMFGDFSFYNFLSKNCLNFLKFQELVKVY